MSDSSRSSVVKCERHGLHYDSTKMTGCVLCRREAGAAPVPAAAAPGAPLGGAIAVTIVLLLAATGVLYATQTLVLDSFRPAPSVEPIRAKPANLDEGIKREMEKLGVPEQILKPPSDGEDD